VTGGRRVQQGREQEGETQQKQGLRREELRML
jgi:hypothetical protein